MRQTISLATCALSLLISLTTGCLGTSESVDEEEIGESSYALPNSGGSDSPCQPGYVMDPFGTCVIQDNPGPIAETGSSCIAPACKTACGTARQGCLSYCLVEPYVGCTADCYAEFYGCVAACCE